MSDETSIPRDRKSMLQIIGVATNLDDPTYFDLLCISESETDSQKIQDRVKERTTILRKYEQYRKDPAVQKLATSLMTQVSNAGRVLRDPARRAEYSKEIEGKRMERFRERLVKILKPGQTVSDAQMQQFLAFARQCGVPEQTARQVVASLTQARENQFAPLGVELCDEDPAWPTAFEILGCGEEIDDDAAVQTAAKKRLEMLQSASIKDADRNFVRRFVNEAARVLASHEGREEYRASVAKKRQARFLEAIANICHAGERPDQRVVMHLMQLARKMRLPTSVARAAVSEKTGYEDFGTDKPSLSINPTHVATNVLPDGTDCKHSIMVRNEGSGKLELIFDPEVQWLRVDPRECETETSRDVVLEILPEYLFPGKPETGSVQVSGNGGSVTITVQTRLGVGEIAELQAWEIRMAKRAYQVCFAQLFFVVHALALVMMFMNHRNRSPYVAFHCMQAIFMSIPCLIVAVILLALFMPTGHQNDNCFNMCVMPLLVLFLLFGWPGIVVKYLDTNPYFFVPFFGNLARRFL